MVIFRNVFRKSTKKITVYQFFLNNFAASSDGLTIVSDIVKRMIKNIVLDFGSVLVDWNPHYLYDDVFGDRRKADWFLDNICTAEWNAKMDAGASFRREVVLLQRKYPQWAAEIELYDTAWWRMMGGTIPGMHGLLMELKETGHALYGLSNWNDRKFHAYVHSSYPIFGLLDGMVLSGEEKVAKPDEKIYHILLDRFNLKADECLFVDDNHANIEVASKLGFKTILFESADALRRELVSYL